MQEEVRMKAALVIMAAGLGSRYGGNKQVDGVGPNGEILMEYSIYDAIRAGFTKIVFVIKPGMEEMMRRICGDYVARRTAADGSVVEVCYAVQDFTGLPAFYHLPAQREKPFGTGHAVLCARPYVNEPFCVINADDYYGVDAYRKIYQALQRLPEQGNAAMVGYLLKNTVSERGTVSRGVCRVEDGRLLGIKETLKIRLEPDGTIADEAEGVLPADAVVSMNFWGFAPSFFRELEMFFYDFLRYEAGDNIKAECMLPSLVGKLIGEGKLKVSVLQSADRWFGMTYHEDRQAVAEELKRLHACGVYPETLRL
jgi:NDP-sugar pyrophosphorylase family protein